MDGRADYSFVPGWAGATGCCLDCTGLTSFERNGDSQGSSYVDETSTDSESTEGTEPVEPGEVSEGTVEFSEGTGGTEGEGPEVAVSEVGLVVGATAPPGGGFASVGSGAEAVTLGSVHFPSEGNHRWATEEETAAFWASKGRPDNGYYPGGWDESSFLRDRDYSDLESDEEGYEEWCVAVEDRFNDMCVGAAPPRTPFGYTF
jgi:hypothetical protein